jgi:hypothetical protein
MLFVGMPGRMHALSTAAAASRHMQPIDRQRHTQLLLSFDLFFLQITDRSQKMFHVLVAHF